MYATQTEDKSVSEQTSRQKQIADALRDLVAGIYVQCQGAYGSDCYEGQFEPEIQAVAKAIAQDS